MDELFAPPDQPWSRLDPRYPPVRAIGAGLTNLALTALAAVTVGLLVGWQWLWGPVLAGLAWTTYTVIHTFRWARTFGYAEREQDLLISDGLWRRNFRAIPYGRMQSVKVESGPIERAWQLSTVSLVTASVQSRATIPGLPRPEAIRLRDRLIEVGEAQASPL